ncbi:hypothetical protein CDL15_Pgr024193 [Punica granatum]|uniref:Uncharacterized protein n=1 Tax=Punica granatum TaxID=22663 RepID=A0A218XWD7_PUNGR|nr:hypothetical protein CDL15_Pgr024193 [Punica granatum]
MCEVCSKSLEGQWIPIVGICGDKGLVFLREICKSICNQVLIRYGLSNFSKLIT